MTENDNRPVTPDQPAQPPREGAEEHSSEGLREELAKVRSRNKVLVTVAVVLGTIFVLAAGAAYVVYMKVSAAKDNIEKVFSSFPPPDQGYRPEAVRLPGQGVALSTAMPRSSLGMFSGGLTDSPESLPDIAAAQEAAQALFKYSDRPIVKEFIADLKKNPEMAAAFAANKEGNPFAVMMSVRNAKGMDKLVASYATRPEFLKLMMEVMNDPEMQPLMSGAAAMGLPTGAPQVRDVSVTAAPPPRQEGGEEEDIKFDASAISGPSARPASGAQVPPPVDSE
ncbi:MAG: hypothetical protein AB7V08_14465 [Elusimicrobiales bacterium]